MKFTKSVSIIFLVLLSTDIANATISVPTIVPAEATTSDFLRVRVTTAICDIFATLGPTDRVLEVSQNVVRMTVLGASTSDFAQCNYPVSNYTYEIGILPTGVYRFELYRRIVLDPTRVDLVGTANFTVSGLSAPLATQVPAFSLFGLIALCGSMLLAVLGMRRYFSS
jgi:hypothetical protein